MLRAVMAIPVALMVSACSRPSDAPPTVPATAAPPAVAAPAAPTPGRARMQGGSHPDPARAGDSQPDGNPAVAAGTETKTGFMSKVARARFSPLTDNEIAALKAFLDSR